VEGLYEERFVWGLVGRGAGRSEEVRGSVHGAVFVYVLEDI
jgi:hypothetical protein